MQRPADQDSGFSQNRTATVDLNEAAERIFKYHWLLIAVVTLLGLAVPFALVQMKDDAYVSSARFVMGAEDARDGQQANALADTALALATSPGLVEKAVEAAQVQRDVAEVAGEIRVDPVGAGGVLQLSVIDREPKAAAALANALAAEVVAQRSDAVLGDTERLLAQTDEQIAALAKNVQDIEAQADAEAAAQAASRARGVEPTTTLEAIRLRHSQAVEQLSRAQAQRQQLAQDVAQAVRPEVIDATATRGALVQNALPARLVVGALLGLILGIALAATLEAWRPTYSPAALARHLGVPLLGRLRRLPQGATTLPDPWLGSYVSLAAEGAGVHSFELVPVGPQVDTTGLARSLAVETEGKQDIVALALEAPHHSRLPAAMTGPGTGIVVVAPRKVKGPWLSALERHAHLTRQPVIGVITYGGKGHVVSTATETASDTEYRRPTEQGSAATAAVTS
jgi:capsular polysaccharide biosynthesis protein